jgi:drug/metabolite transporter (DMT)-like permease
VSSPPGSPARDGGFRLGLGLLVGGAVFLAVAAACASGTTGKLDVEHLIVARSAVWLAWLGPWGLRHPRLAWGRNHRWLLLEAVANTIFLFLYTLSLIRIPVALATTILAGTTPLWVAGFEAGFSGVRPRPGEVGGMLVILSGIVMVVQPGRGAADSLGVAAAIGSAACFALVYVGIGRLRDTDSPHALNLWYTVLALIVALPFLGRAGIPALAAPWLLAAGYGVFGLIGQTMVVVGTSRLTPEIGAVNGALVPVFASILGVAVFHQALSLAQGLGIVVVLSGTAFVSLEGVEKRKMPAAEGTDGRTEVR